MNTILLNIKERIIELGYNHDIPELNKISNILKNKQSEINIKKNIFSLSRRLYELGIMDNKLDSLLNQLFNFCSCDNLDSARNTEFNE